MNNKHVINNTKNTPVESITLNFVEDAIKLTNNSFIRVKIGYKFVKKGWIQLENQDYTNSFKNFNKALSIFVKRKNLQGYLLSRHGIATIFNECKQYINALNIYFEILNKLNESDLDLKFIILKDIANTYYLWGSYKNSVKYLRMAMDTIKSEKSVYRKIYINYSLGRSYSKQNKTDKAQESFFMALTLCDANGVNYKISETLTKLGNIFRKKQNMVRSESFHIRALQYAKSSNDYNSYIEVLINLGCLMFYSSEYKKCNQYILSALEEINHVKSNYSSKIKAYHYLFLSNKELNNIDEALQYLQKSMVIKEEEIKRVTHIQWSLLGTPIEENRQKIDLNWNTIKNNTFNSKSKYQNLSLGSENLLELSNALYHGVKDIIHFSKLSLYSYTNDKKSLNKTTILSNGRSSIEEISPEGTPAEVVITQNKEIIIYDAITTNSDIKFNSNKLTKGMKSFIVLPIIRGSSVIGAISIEDAESNKYTQFELNTLKTISAYISLTIENLRMKDELESLNSLVDNETISAKQQATESIKLIELESGLPLKILFKELLAQALKGTKRENGKVALFTIIVDYDFNNKGSFLSEDIITGSHTITERIKSILRSEDILGKESDDTYLLAAKIQSIRGCKTVVKKLVNEIKQPIFTENQKIQPRVRVGISIYPDNYLTLEELMGNSHKTALKVGTDSITGFEFSEQIHNITGID